MFLVARIAPALVQAGCECTGPSSTCLTFCIEDVGEDLERHHAGSLGIRKPADEDLHIDATMLTAGHAAMLDQEAFDMQTSLRLAYSAVYIHTLCMGIMQRQPASIPY